VVINGASRWLDAAAGWTNDAALSAAIAASANGAARSDFLDIGASLAEAGNRTGNPLPRLLRAKK
jgi:hypothetical protein